MFTTKPLTTIDTSRSLLREGSIFLFSTFLIALSGKVSIPLWFTPVPLATQNSVILLLSVFLGPRRAAAAVFAFLLQGAMGFPIFSTGSVYGIARFIGPTGGYLTGYLVAAYITGLLATRLKTEKFSEFLALASGNLVIYILGAGYLASFMGIKQAILLGVFPFILGDLLKLLASVKVLQWIRWRA